MKTITKHLSIVTIGVLSILGIADSKGSPFNISAAELQLIEPESWGIIDPADGKHPTERHETSFVKVGEYFYLLGGRDRDPVGVYDPVAQTWSERMQIPVEMHHFQAVEIDGLVYVVGAFTGSCCKEPPIPIVYIYDPYDDEWIEGPEIPAERRRGSAGAVVYNDEIYLISGLQVGHDSGWVTWVDRYNPATNEWQVLPNAPRARDHFHAGLVEDKIVAAGGRNSGRDGIFNYTIGEVDVYDISSGSWSTATNNLPTERAGTAAAVLGNELLIIGGETTRSEAYVETEAFNVLTGQWRTLNGLTGGRHGMQAITHNDVVYVAAGSASRGSRLELDTLEAFNFAVPPTSVGEPLIESSLVAENDIIDFNEHLIGRDVTQEMILTNSGGNQAIVLTNIELGDETVFAYDVSHTLPIVIEPGATTSITIGFQAEAEEVYSTEMLISHSGKDGGTTVTLRGSGSFEPLENQPPIVVQPIADLVVDEDSSSTSLDLSSFFSDPDQAAATLIYGVSTSGFPATLITTVAGSALSILPLPNAHGVVSITVQATDIEGLSVSDEFLVTVNPINDAPFVVPIPDQQTAEGIPLTIEIIADDPDSESLDFDVSVKPNMDLASFVLGKNSQGTLRFEPGFDDEGLHTVTVAVRDPEQLSASHIFTIEVTERNSTPIISKQPPLSVSVGNRVTRTIGALDLDGDQVTILSANLPDFVELGETIPSANGYSATLLIAPSEGDQGNYDIPIRAVDPAGLFTETILALTVPLLTVANHPPAISPSEDLTITVGTVLTVNLSVADEDVGVNINENLTISVSGIPSNLPFGVTLDDSKLSSDGLALVVWDGSTPVGKYPIAIRVTDSGGLSDETRFVVDIRPVTFSLPPQPVSGVGSPEIRIGELYSLTVQFVDPNADQVTLQAISMPAGAHFTDLSNGIGLFEWQPLMGTLGQHDVLISATDSTGLSTVQRYTLLVTRSNTLVELFFPVHH